VFSWTGCYVGANAGWVGSRDQYRLQPAGNYLNALGGAAPPNVGGTGDFPASIAALTTTYAQNGSGGTVGGTAGCQGQINGVVIGIESDLNWANSNSSADAAFAAFANPGNPAFTNQARTEHVANTLNAFGTLRARVGLTWDRVLVYATGGPAFGSFRSNTAVLFGTGVGAPVYDGAQHVGASNTTRIGAAVGGGLEYAFADNWSAKFEYLHLRFENLSYASPLVAATPAFAPGYAWQTQVFSREHIVRVGLNYRLDWASAVVARY
jgi:outer membrane immunogenic protein